jgi:AraC family transcriptional regulator, transcriptional activator of pobA
LIKKASHIPQHNLDKSFYHVHKERLVDSQFGLDNTDSLISDGFGLYSSAGLKPKIGPIKSEFYRIGFGVTGGVEIQCGLEQFGFYPGCIAFTIPGQIFSMQNKTDDLLVYYMLFTEQFVGDAFSLHYIRDNFPFLNYAGQQSFKLEDGEALEIQNLILKINDEIKQKKHDIKEMIQVYIHLILLQANRTYQNLEIKSDKPNSSHALLVKYKRLVSRHFLETNKVGDYADKLYITAGHLNKVVKAESGKTAHQLIEEMLFLEAKALLRHTDLSITEIAYRLNFTDPSHFNKFFKNQNGETPLHFRKPELYQTKPD